MSGIFVLLGSNLQDRLRSLQRAKQLLQEREIEVINQSSVYQTAAWGHTQQPAYLNQVLEVSTPMPPHNLLRVGLAIESEMGRQRSGQWQARTLDIDLLYYHSQIINRPDLEIPHPRLHLRRFTLVPLTEIAPDAIHPVLKKSNRQLLEACPDTLSVELYPAAN